MNTSTHSTPWSDVNAIYQIYPRSFMDGNNDGVGDLKGVISKLDYLHNTLGIRAVWFSPFFPSPMADFGYDVSNYCDIHPLFGTLDDFRELLDRAHNVNIKVMIDFVPNHTSNEHPWFLESKATTDNPKRNYYTWRNPRPDGSPPNNWLSIFGGSAWEFDDATGQYYLHTFLKEQPDLNWDNPEVRAAMQNVLRFWFDMGVDGIRADAVRWISKDPELRNDPKNPNFRPKRNADEFWSLLHTNSRFGAKLFDYLREMTDVVEQYDNRIMIFEDYPDELYSTREQYLGFYGVNPRVSMPFNFEGIGLPFSADAYRTFISDFQGMLNQDEHTPVYCFGNHDQARLATRIGSQQAKLVAVMQLSLPGLPVVYYGDELGMVDGIIKPDQIQDPVEKRKPGLNQGRDPERTPMQWDAGLYAGFSTVEPWLPVAGGADLRNVQTELHDPDSFLTFYRCLLAHRSRYDIFCRGDYETFGEADEQVFMFSRRLGEQHIFVALNFSDETARALLPHGGRVLCGSYHTDPPLITDDGVMSLRPYEGVIIDCAKHPLSSTNHE